MNKWTPIIIALASALLLGMAAPRAQEEAVRSRDQGYDELLDVNVRDGFVYYRALKSERGRLDAYINALAGADVASAPRNDQIAFWLNAYNALVLQTVIDHYPIAGRSSAYPSRSIRQIPGAFEKVQHRVGGRIVTLDEIEQSILPGFHEPRVFLVLGRGAVGGGRLRSEAYRGSEIGAQLSEAAGECLSHGQCVTIDRTNNKVKVSSIFSWREKDFSAAYADQALPVFAERSPIERAVLAFVNPKLLTTERDFLAQNAFKVEYIPFDWALNDLTDRPR